MALIQLIETMPTMFGEQLYPSGLPMQSIAVSFEGRTIQEIFFDNCDGDFGEETEDSKILHDYMLYYLNAPCWHISDEDKEIAPSLSNDELFDLLLDNGIDPF